MTKKHLKSDQASTLRQRAEEKARAEVAEAQESLSPEAARQALHELRVRRIELEMQNEELRCAQKEMEASRARHVDLYDLAPVGYVTLSEKGLILEANLTAATLLGVARDALIKQPLTRFILPVDQDIYYRHRKQLFETGAPQVCELRLMRSDSAPFWARLEAIAVQDADGAPVCRTTVSDITERKGTEEMLRRAVSEYRTLAENLPDLLARFDSRLRHTYVNPAAARSGVLSAEQYIGKTIAESGVPAPIAREWQERIRAVFLTGEPLKVEHEFPTPEGSRFFLTTLVPERAEDGSIRSVLSLARDITERKQAEKALLALSSRQEALLSAVPDIIMEVDSNKVYTWANRAAIEFFGEDVIGREAAFYFEGEQDTYGLVKPLFNGDENVVYVESWQRRRDGQKRLLAWWCRVLKDEKGNVTGALSTARDITERMRVQEALRQSEDRFRMLFEEAPIGYQSLDEDGHLVVVNKTWLQMLGYADRDEIIGRPFADFIAPEDRGRFPQNFARFKALGEVYGVEYELVRKDGSLLIAALDGTIGRDQQGRFKRTHCTVRDISERKRAEETLQVQARELARSNAFLRALSQVAARLETTRAPEHVMTTLGTGLKTLGMECLFGVLEPDGEALTFPYISMRPAAFSRAEKLAGRKIADLRVPLSLWPLTETVGQRKPVFVPDPLSVAAAMLKPIPRKVVEIVTRAAGVAAGVKAVYLPLSLEGHVVGVLSVWGKDVREQDMPALSVFASQVAVALENARLYAAQRQRVEELARTGEQLRMELADRTGAEGALRASQEKYRVLVENAAEAIFVAQDGMLKFVNDRSEEIIGYPKEELLSKPFTDFVHPDDRALVLDRHVMRQRGEAVPSRYSFRIVNSSGETRWGELNVVPIEWEGKVASLNFLSDITERKQAEERDSLVAKVLDRLSQPLSATDTIRDILQLVKISTGIEAVGIRLREGEDFPYYETNGFPDHLLQMERYLCARDEAGAIVRDTEGNPVLEGMCGNILSRRTNRKFPFFTEGGSFWSNCTTDLLASTTEADRQSPTRNRCNSAGYESVALIPLRSSDEIIGLLQLNDHRRNQFTPEMIVFLEGLGASIGIALSRKRAEEALAAERSLLRTLVDHLPDAVYVKDGACRKTLANPADVRNMGAASEAEALGKTDFDFFPHDLAAAFYADDRSVIQSGRSVLNREEMITLPDRARGWQLTSKIPLRDSAGQVVGLVGIGHDITERKRLEEHLLQSQKIETVGRLAGGIAHDFNNLLTAILGYATFALESLPASGPVRRDIEQIVKAAERAANLTRQLLAFSRRQIIQMQAISLNDLIMNMDKMLRRLIGEDIELVTVPGDDVSPVRADPGQLEQVLVNLVVNARDAMPGGGTLTIETANVSLDEEYVRQHPGAEPGAYVMLAVTDTGTGMTDEVKSHLFEPYFTTKEVGKGTGLGLSTVYGIVKQHGGTIYVYSEVGKGSAFKVYLPAVEGEAEGLPRRDAVGYLPQGNETVLVVEDEATVRAFTVRTLAELGYKPLEASDGEEALRVAQEHPGPIHLLLTDVVMPQMGGKELAERMKVERPDIRVLFASGYTDDAIVHNGILDKGLAFLQKPFTTTALARKVREVLDQT